MVTPDAARRDQLRVWTAQELDRIGQRELEIFLFTAVDPVATSPQKLFFGHCWYEPMPSEPVSLLIPPALPQPVEPSTNPPVSAPVVTEVWRAGG